MDPKPKPPFHAWPVQEFDPAVGFVWWAHPAAVVTHATAERATLAGARLIQGWIDDALTYRADEVRSAGGLFVFHDWRSVRGYDTDARKYYLERMRARPRDYLRHSVAVVPPNPLVRMAMEMGNLAASLTARARVEVANDATATLAKHGLRPPVLGERFPGK